MKKKYIPYLLTISVIGMFVWVIINLPKDYYAALGSMIAATGSILAVIWFYTSLQCQSKQLEDQRTQFINEFRQIREDGRRNSLILAKDILNETEKRIFGQNPDLKNISDLMPLYLQFFEFKPILEEVNPKIVQHHVQEWLKKEGPALTLMKGIKSAAEIYFKAIGLNNIDYSKEAEEFVYIYGPQIWKAPFFDIYETTATMLAEFMIRLEPGRKAVLLASMVSMCKLAPSGFIKEDKLKEDIEKHKEKKYPLAQIVKEYIKEKFN